MSLHQLYRHFDQHGHLLYVGQSISALARLLSHKSSPWIADIAFVSIDRYESADALNEAEAVAIAHEAPIYNRVQPNSASKRPKSSDGSAVPGKPAKQPLMASRLAPPGPSDSIKRGRPRIGETRDKPWIAAGMSERTWYRRRKEGER